MKILGLDIGNAKLKMCLIDSDGELSEEQIEWKSVPLSVSTNRADDFRLGLPFQVMMFGLVHGFNPKELDGVVVCSSHSMSFDHYPDSIRLLAEILPGMFGGTPVWLIRADAQLTPLEAIRSLPESALYAHVLTNFVGSAWLGSQQIQNGLALDIGTTTTDIIPIVDGQIDPQGLQDPNHYLRFRYAHQRINWYGLTATHLTQLADRVPLHGWHYSTVSREYFTDVLFALLDNTDPDLMTQHAYANLFPSKEQASRQLSQFIGQDLLPPEDLASVRDFLYQRLIERVSGAIQSVTREVFGGWQPDLEVAVYALGEQVLARPALHQAGFKDSQMRYLQFGREQQLWSASSVFAMALRGLQELLGKPVKIA